MYRYEYNNKYLYKILTRSLQYEEYACMRLDIILVQYEIIGIIVMQVMHMHMMMMMMMMTLIILLMIWHVIGIGFEFSTIGNA